MDPVEEPQRLVPVPGALDGEALAVQARGQRLAVGLLVVDHQHERSVVAARGEFVVGRPLVTDEVAMGRTPSGRVVRRSNERENAWARRS